MRKVLVALAVALVALLVVCAGCTGSDGTAKTGDSVSVYYTLSVNGEEIQSNVDSTPLTFTLGAGEVVKGFDSAVLGMAVGQTKTVTIPPELGYGNLTLDNQVSMSLSTTETDLGKTVKEGDGFTVYVSGMQYLANVLSIDRSKDTVLVALNHYLAGKTLVFEITLFSINA